MPRRFEPPEQRESYSLTGRLDSLIEHRIAHHRRVLEARTGWPPNGVWPFPSGAGRGELRNEPPNDEGWEE